MERVSIPIWSDYLWTIRKINWYMFKYVSIPIWSDYLLSLSTPVNVSPVVLFLFQYGLIIYTTVPNYTFDDQECFYSNMVWLSIHHHTYTTTYYSNVSIPIWSDYLSKKLLKIRAIRIVSIPIWSDYLSSGNPLKFKIFSVSIPIWSDYLYKTLVCLVCFQEFLFQYGLIIYENLVDWCCDDNLFLFQYGLIIYQFITCSSLVNHSSVSIPIWSDYLFGDEKNIQTTLN